jgi:hypothetical protein
MLCKVCGSIIERKFKAEMGVRSFELEKLANPAVWVFPELFVCLDCGTTEFTVPKTELRLLAEGDVAAAGNPKSSH